MFYPAGIGARRLLVHTQLYENTGQEGMALVHSGGYFIPASVRVIRPRPFTVM